MRYWEGLKRNGIYISMQNWHLNISDILAKHKS